MPSVTLEALMLVALTTTLVVSAYAQLHTDQGCTLSYNPLTQINNAVQAAYIQPYTKVAAPINATLTITTHKNTIKYYGCRAPQPTIADPASIVAGYNISQIQYSVLFADTVLAAPCTLSVTYDPLNHTMLVQCS